MQLRGALFPVFLPLLPLLGCSAAQTLVRDPLADKCKETGLKGCEDLADGFLLYVEGQKPLGYDKVKQGVSVNLGKPEQIKLFVGAARLLQKAPGVGPYLKTAEPILDMMDAAAEEGMRRRAERGAEREEREERSSKPPRGKPGEAPPGPAATTGPGEPVAVAEPSAGRLARLRAGTAIVPGAPKATPCKALGGTPIGAVEGSQCLPLFLDTLVVTDFQTPGGCPYELVLLAGSLEAPSWYLIVPPGSAANLHGGSLPVAEGDRLVLVARPTPRAPLAPLGSCSATWVGVRG